MNFFFKNFYFNKQTEFVVLAKEFSNSAEIVKEIKKTYPEIILLKHNNPIEKELLNGCYI